MRDAYFAYEGLRETNNHWFYESDQDFQGKDRFVISVKRGSRYEDVLLDTPVVTHLTTSSSTISMDTGPTKHGVRFGTESRQATLTDRSYRVIK